MRDVWHFLFATSLILEGIGAIILQERDVPAVFSLDIQRNDVSDPVSRDRARRKRDTVSKTLDNEDTLYFCNVTLGTPAQSLRLVLDTGSSDLWCSAANSTLCTSRHNPCNVSGSYDPDSSSTNAFVSSDFNISYADGTGAAGDYFKDVLRIGNATIKNVQFGVGFSTSSPEGVLGIGYPSNEAQAGMNGKNTYQNLPSAMVKNGLIKSSAYSLWLNDLDANTGSILFGGVNTEKYHGVLQTLPIQKADGGYSEFIIALTGVALKTKSSHQNYSSDELPAGVLLDSGSSLTYLPDSIVDVIYNNLSVTYDSSSEVGYVPCSLANENINITYTFSSPTITVGIDELVLDAGDMHFRNGARACVFGIVPAGNSTAVLGDTFLRSAYVVYDLANNEISFANTNFNSTKDKILQIGTGSNAVPSATLVPHPVTSVVTVGTGAIIGGPTGTVSEMSGGATITRPAGMSHLALGLTAIVYMMAF